MKNVLIIVGIIGLTGFIVLVVLLTLLIGAARRELGPALYASMGSSTRIQEYAHAQGKTNYIAYADQQVATIQSVIDSWQKTASNTDPAKLKKAETDAYATMDKNIRNGLNPLAFLDGTNAVLPPIVMPQLTATNQ